MTKLETPQRVRGRRNHAPGSTDARSKEEGTRAAGVELAARNFLAPSVEDVPAPDGPAWGLTSVREVAYSDIAGSRLLIGKSCNTRPAGYVRLPAGRFIGGEARCQSREH